MATTPATASPGWLPWRPAAAGVLAALVALGVGELMAALTDPATSPIIAVSSTFIDLTPEWLKAFAIATFGSDDKLVLLVGVGITLLVVAAIIGIVAARSLRLGLAGVGLFGLVGGVATLTRPGTDLADLLPTILGTGAAVVTLAALIRSLRPTAGEGARLVDTAPARPTVMIAEGDPLLPADGSRRRFLTLSAGALGLAAGSTIAARLVRAAPSTATLGALPLPVSPADAIPAGADLAVPGVSSFVTPNASFYRVDTALVVPTIDPSTWRLRVVGMVERELEFDLAALLARPMIERVITLTCVSNTVGGRYAGNATWLGVPLRDLLEEAGILPGSDQLLSRSVDGMSIGTPVSAVLDGRDAMVALAMNGEPLPAEHGFPARLVVPGLYGYVSATKWLTELELTTFDAYDAYWVQRGWAAEAPIKTMSRIDTPKPLATVPAGTIAVAGVAWAQQRGIQGVQVRIDEGPWADAQLADQASIDTWRQWHLPWQATPGRHRLEVRAIDGEGEIQIGDRAEPFPDGATGWHSVVMTVA